MSHNSFVYLDDGFGSQPERTSAVAAAFIQRKELDSSGLLVNEEKSHWVPTQVGEWLGFVINTISMTFRIPEKKVCKFKRLLNSAIQNKSSSYRELARIAGSIISVALAVGPISRLLTKQMYLAIEFRSAWDHIFLFPPALLEELKFWFCTLNLLMVTPFAPPPPGGTLIIPEWPSAYFWPLLRDGPSRFKSFVREVFVLPAIKDLILEGPGQRQIY